MITHDTNKTLIVNTYFLRHVFVEVAETVRCPIAAAAVSVIPAASSVSTYEPLGCTQNVP